MKDLILTSFLKAFAEQYGLTDLDEAAAFEHFVSHCTISKHYPDAFDPESVVTGEGGDLGIDAIGVIVNEHLVSAKEDVDHFKRVLRRLDVDFIFVQAKTSAHFDGAEIGNFINGVRQFFGKELPEEANDRIVAVHDIKEHILASSIDMDRSPTCRLYYVTTGTWTGEGALTARIEQGKADLFSTGLFSSVEFVPLDAEGLKRLYRDLHNKITREIVFDKHTILPNINGVKEAYIGIVPCQEYLKLVCEDDGTLNRRLFYDNVRDFQGHNSVNLEIRETIRDAERNDLFALLNNGVTVVARDLNKVGTTFRLKDYQVVNGCQTSHMLYLNRDSLSSKVYLSLKLIVTADPAVTNQITHGTNRQTEVKPEAFESLTPFQKKLEEYFVVAGKTLAEPVFYERRSKQHDHLEVSQERIITLAAQLKCFLAMFLNEPHSTHRYYGELLGAYRTRLFGDAHLPVPYFVSGVGLAAVERLFLSNTLPRFLRRFKYQMLMVFRLMNENGDLPFMNSKSMEKYCQHLLGILDNPGHTEEQFKNAGKLVESVLKDWKEGREAPERTKAFTLALTAAVGKVPKAASATRMSGIVKAFSDTRGWGFITGGDKVDYFVHYSNISGPGYRTLAIGQPVQFTSVSSDRGLQAVDVERDAE